MIVRNEQTCLGRCLGLVAGAVDEIVVVDTGSTDQTREVAGRFGARVISCAWESDFSKARNRGLEEARGRWILVLDADEQLLETDRRALLQLVAAHTPETGPPRTAFNLLQRNSSDGGRTGMIVPNIRLFPNLPGIRYEWPIHEQVATSLARAGIPVRESSVSILHDGYADSARNSEKQRRNREILRAQLRSSSEVHPLTHFLLAGAELDLENPEGALGSYLECIRLSPGGGSVAEAAKVRVATCLAKLGRHAEALAGMPLARDPASWHPELLKLKGDCEAALGRRAPAREAYVGVLGFSDAAFVPPCNLVSVKVGAMLGLAMLLKKENQHLLATELLRAVKERVANGEELNQVSLARLLQSGA